MSGTSTAAKGSSEPSGKGSLPKEKTSRTWELPSFRQASMFLFALVLAMGVALYVGWCFSYHDCTDNGLYSVTVVLVAYGLVGLWLMTPSRSRAA